MIAHAHAAAAPGRDLPFAGAGPGLAEALAEALDARDRYTAGHSLRVADFHVSQLSRENRILPTRATEERAKTTSSESTARNVCLSAMVPAVRRTGHPFAVSSPMGPSQKIKFVFAASPETIRREPREFDLLRSVGDLRDLAACASCDPDIFFPTARRF